MKTDLSPLLPRRNPGELQRARRAAVDAQTLLSAQRIVDDVHSRGLAALHEHALAFGDIQPGDPLVLQRQELLSALDSLSSNERRVLEQAAERIAHFATLQRNALLDVRASIPDTDFIVGHRVLPLASAGCYAPGGRFPLPSSVLMTALVAKTAGVSTVWCASPRPALVTKAAAALAGVDGLLCVGGAQAIAAMAYGVPELGLPASDIVVGPGNRYVTAAKQLVSTDVAIDMLAGPSEVLIIADDSAPAEFIAADLLAQAEHDPDAIPVLLSTSCVLLDSVEASLTAQLRTLPSAQIARQALRNGASVLVSSLSDAAELSNALAPEHLQIMTREDEVLARKLDAYGALFIGPGAAEVLGDYGLGPNHVLPTGGTARHSTGLSVLTFLRPRTFIERRSTTNSSSQSVTNSIYQDVATFARMEGLEAHARAAEARVR